MVRFADPTDLVGTARTALGDYNGYLLSELGGRFYGVPDGAGPVCWGSPGIKSSPWTVVSGSLAELKQEIDRRCLEGEAAELVESFVDYEIYSCRQQYYAVATVRREEFFRNQPVADEDILIDESLPSLRKRVLAVLGRNIHGEILGELEGYILARTRDHVTGYPIGLAGAELLPEEDFAAAGVYRARERASVEHAIVTRPGPREVEFAGWLPAFRIYGDCGRHPQFGHATVPPAGYRFIQSAPRLREPRRWLDGRRMARDVLRFYKVVRAAGRLGANCLARGASLRQAASFVLSRGLKSQLSLPRRNNLLFLTSVPFTLGQDPWVIEIEDATSLLYPFVHNGRTAELDIAAQPVLRNVRALLEQPNCRAIVTHVRATREGISKLFCSDAISQKTVHIPMGVGVPRECQRHEPAPTLNLLVTNSWHQKPGSFYLRGGLDVLEAFSALQPAFPELHLTLRTRLPDDLPPRYRRIIDECQVTVLDKFLSAADLERLMLSSHLFLLPSARIHIMSVLQAMSYGLIPVVSDGWGMEEYVADRQTGMVVRGRYGKVSWNDEQNGMLRENYAPLYRCDRQVSQNLVDAIAELAARQPLRRELGARARQAVISQFNLPQWNVALKRVLDRAWTGA
ncbi:MAG: glycosyltransferase family 4 protein [Planctomycetia bacterium]|nr:glycosyltransferase family 4 protein [Planctomycetia bacterium]